MTLSRRDLEEGRMRAVYMEAVDPRHPLTDEQLASSLAATLEVKPAASEWWVFAYGSLLWNPLFPFEDARPATLSGRHRRFCLWSLASRGTCNQPGLVLGLDRGGSCQGVAYRLPARSAHAELELLWRREMVLGAYHPLWVNLRSAGKLLVALAFVVDRAHRQYAGKLSGGLSRAHAHRPGYARHCRSVSRTAGEVGREAPAHSGDERRGARGVTQ